MNQLHFIALIVMFLHNRYGVIWYIDTSEMTADYPVGRLQNVITVESSQYGKVRN